MKERWKPIEGFEGIYEISDHGSVKSLARFRSNGSWYKEKILKPGRANYLQVSLVDRYGVRGMYSIHVLVMRAFGGKKPVRATVVMHKDDDRSNNHYKNLKWGTHAQNSADMVRKGRSSRGERNCRAAIDSRKAKAIYTLAIKPNVTLKLVAEKFNVTRSHVWLIKNGCLWTHVTGHPRYERSTEKK